MPKKGFRPDAPLRFIFWSEKITSSSTLHYFKGDGL